MADDIKQLQEDFKKLNEQVRALNGSFFEEIPTNVNALKNGIKFLNDELRSAKDIAGSLASSLKDSISELSKGDTNTKRIIGGFKSLESIASKFKYDMLEYSVMSKKDITNNITKIQQNKDLLQSILNQGQIEQDVRKLGLETEAEITAEIQRRKKETQFVIDQSDKLLQYAEKRLEEEKKIQRQLGLTGAAVNGIVGALGKLGVNSIFFDGLKEDLRDAAKSTSSLGKFGTSAKVVFTAISGLTKGIGQALTDPLTILTFFVTQGLKANRQSVELGKSLGISASEANKLRQNFVEYSRAADDAFVTTDRLLKAQSDLSEQLGFSVKFSGKETEEFSRLVELTGLSAEEAGKLAKASAASGLEIDKYVDSLRLSAFYAGQSTKTHFSSRSILQEIAKLSSGILVKFQGNPTALGDAVVQAKALGSSLEQVDKVGESLLNFETSIENELKAELLTSRQLNLERARYAALTGDQLTLTKEITDQVGTLADFQSMNVIAQKSLAEAFGLSRDEMADMLLKQQNLNKYGDLAKDATDEQLKNYELLKKTQSDLTLEQFLKDQEQQLTAQLKFNNAVTKLQDVIGNIVAGPLGSFLDTLSKSLETITSIGIGLGTVWAISKGIAVVQGISTALTVRKMIAEEGYAAFLAVSNSFLAKGLALQVANATAWVIANPIAALAGLGLAAGVGALVYGSMQQVKDGQAPPSDGPFTVTNRFGETAITTTGDGIAVGPNIKSESASAQLQSSLDLTPMINAINEVRSAVTALANRPINTNISIDGKAIGTAVGKQLETGTAQLQYSSYKVA